MADFVFHDPSGRRARRANLGLGLLVAAAAQVVAGAPVQHRHGVALLKQLGHHQPADELSPSDNQTIHALISGNS